MSEDKGDKFNSEVEKKLSSGKGELVWSTTLKDGGFEFDVETYKTSNGFAVYINDQLAKQGFSTMNEAGAWGRRQASDLLYKKIHG